MSITSSEKKKDLILDSFLVGKLGYHQSEDQRMKGFSNWEVYSNSELP